MRSAAPPPLEDFAGAPLTVRSGELFNPPALTNLLGCLQAAFDLVGVQHVTFAPLSCGESLLGACAVNGVASMAAGQPIEFLWRPDRIERRLALDGLELRSITVMGVRRRTLAVELRVTNPAATERRVELRLLAGTGVVHSTDGWMTPYSPRECPAISTTPWEGTPPPASLVRNRVEPLADGTGLVCTSRTSEACLAHRCEPVPTRLVDRALEFSLAIPAGGSRSVVFHASLARDRATALAALEPLPAFPSLAAAAEADWRAEIAAAFTPGNDRFSGHLPVLATAHDALRALYLNAVITVLYFKRELPDAARPRTYTTLMPRYWVTTSFINDWSLTALLLVLLDPACVRATIELWLERDVHRHFGVEYASGRSTGNWYSCNDYAMTRLIGTYLRVTGERAWLDHVVGDRTVLAHLTRLATHFRSLTGPSGLADYGDRNSLLEAVGTYEHEVASLNAANIWGLRELAAVLAFTGDHAEAAALRAEAAALVPRVRALEAPDGWSHCRQPDGSLVPVRHIWDFIHVLNFLHDDLPPERVRRMVDFFARELQTPHWLAALSPLDGDAGFSLRPDHQWNGSYPGWVALAVGALARAGELERLAAWLPGLARTAAQGPFSQAHFTEAYAPLHAGGARKAPTEWPYINDWAALCGGGFLDAIVLDLFGVDFGFTQLAARPRVAALDPAAALHGVRWHGRDHTIRADGSISPAPLPA